MCWTSTFYVRCQPSKRWSGMLHQRMEQARDRGALFLTLILAVNAPRALRLNKKRKKAGKITARTAENISRTPRRHEEEEEMSDENAKYDETYKRLFTNVELLEEIIRYFIDEGL